MACCVFQIAGSSGAMAGEAIAAAAARREVKAWQRMRPAGGGDK